MSYTLFRTVTFGPSYGGLATVGYQLVNADNTLNGSRITAGVTERGTSTGVYGATITLPDGFVGEVRWDTGGSPAKYASASVNPADAETLSGITSLASWLGALAGKAADPTTLAEINATTAGAGYDNTTDSQEAQADATGAALLINGTVNDVSATTTSFVAASGLSSTNDFYNGAALVFTSGTLQGITRQITDYVGSTRTFTFTVPFPAAPANGVTFSILGRIE